MKQLGEWPSGPVADWQGCIATIGVFDGVHLGHRAILDRMLSWARTEQRPAVVVTFSIHPDLVVHGKSPPRIQSLQHRLRELERCGVDGVLALPFNEELRQREPEDFVDSLFVHALGIRGLVLGHDTAIGRNRRGDATLLDELGRSRGFEVTVVGEIAVDGEIASSTRIRAALQRGDLEGAARLLGRQPSVLGKVVAGEGRGRTIGFPTANLSVGSDCLPAEGVYAALTLLDGHRYRSLCNIGRRPTFHDGTELQLEAHLLDFDGNLYGRELEVVFLARLRGEKKFAGPAELVAQIERDHRQAQQIFARVGGPSSRA